MGVTNNGKNGKKGVSLELVFSDDFRNLLLRGPHQSLELSVCLNGGFEFPQLSADRTAGAQTQIRRHLALRQTAVLHEEPGRHGAIPYTAPLPPQLVFGNPRRQSR
jgi:hypothetical protein